MLKLLSQTGELDGIAWSGIRPKTTQLAGPKLTNGFLTEIISDAWLAEDRSLPTWTAASSLPDDRPTLFRVLERLSRMMTVSGGSLGRRSIHARERAEDAVDVDPETQNGRP